LNVRIKSVPDLYSQEKTIAAHCADLEKMIFESENRLNELGMVNLKAPELFEHKKKELADIQGKIQTLESEREAVFSLINEIETKKKTLL
jgi:chromosome segregation ATPase